MKYSNVPGRVAFFRKVKESISDERFFTAIELAYNMAKAAHKGQLRDDGVRYFNHVKAVAWTILTETQIKDQLRLTILVCVALLHDLMEDTFIAKKRHLHFIFDQISPDITNSIWVLTNPKRGNKWRKLLSSISVVVKLIKAADRLHNLRTLLNCREEKIDRKIEETRNIIVPWLRDLRRMKQRIDLHEIELLTDTIETALLHLEEIQRNK